MNYAKLEFLKNQFLPLLKKTDAETAGSWGKMNAQQMTEHLADFFKLSYNKIHFDLVTPTEHLPKYREFLMSEKEFRENTRAPVLPEEPFPVRTASMTDALEELVSDVNSFFTFFKENPDAKTGHPVFGELNFAEWVQLHHKHVTHHLKQFGLL
jgi:oxepin-CoA hydrolase/3-oxo-5,6-dehydrosuberyl-CoA semialdehyde dehydrogenase